MFSLLTSSCGSFGDLETTSSENVSFSIVWAGRKHSKNAMNYTKAKET